MYSQIEIFIFITICSTSIGVRPPRFNDCVYGIRGTTRYVTSNYLDVDENGNERERRTRDEIIQTINDIHYDCGGWRPRAHNCEHVATYIRYGFQHSEQVMNMWTIGICLLFVMSVIVNVVLALAGVNVIF